MNIPIHAPHCVATLIDELSVLPSLAPTTDADTQRLRARFKIVRSDDVTIIVAPDNADQDAIAAVIAAHDPTPPPVPPKPDYGTDPYDLKQVAQAVTAMRAFVANPSPSAAQVVAQVKFIDSVLLALLKRSL